jgi:hypothetical protein
LAPATVPLGAFVGGAIGGAVGFFGGKKAGEVVGDLATTTSGEEALDAAVESGLYNKDYLGNSEINPEILAVTEDTRQLNAILADGDLSAEDHSKVLTRLESLSQGTATPAATTPGPVEGTATPVIPERDPNRFDGMSPRRAASARRRESLQDRQAVSDAGGIIIGDQPFYPGQEEPLTENQMAAIESGLVMGNSLESFPPEVQEKYKQQMQDQGSSFATATPAATTTPELEGTATPAATTPGFVEGTTTPVTTTPGFVEGTATPVTTTPTVLPLIDGPTPPPFVIPEGFEPLIDGNGKIITELGFSNSPQQIQSINSGSVTQSPSVTSNAIQNMTNLSTSSTQSAPPIINNITNNNTSASPAAPQILTTPSTPRNNSNIIQRFQDRTFAGI